MNKTGKLLSLLLVLAIVFSLSVAGRDTTYTITVNGSGTVADHTFEAYHQIFKGRPSRSGNRRRRKHLQNSLQHRLGRRR